MNSNGVFNVRPATIKKILDKGYTDINLFHMNNFLRPFKTFDNAGRMSFTYKTIGNQLNWTIDQDGTNFKEISDILLYYSELKIPHPAMIVKTSEFNYHILYKGASDIWTPEARSRLVYTIAQVNPGLRNPDEIKEALRSGGVDPWYFGQNPAMSKIRIPGSVNAKNGFICEGWVNDDYSIKEAKEKVNTLGKKKIIHLASYDYVEKVQMKRDVAFHSFESKKPCVEGIFTEALIGLPSDKIVKFIDFIMSQLGSACKGELIINQEVMAEMLGLSQPTVSRILKVLHNKKVMHRTRGFYHDPSNPEASFSCTYELSLEVIKKIYLYRQSTPATKRSKKPDHDLSTPYTKSSFNEVYLKDIYGLIIGLDFTEEMVVDFIYRKNLNRPKNEQKSRNEIQSKVRSSYKWYVSRHKKFTKAG
jgi:DNA-binding Lrp family transcriptional regulator